MINKVKLPGRSSSKRPVISGKVIYRKPIEVKLPTPKEGLSSSQYVLDVGEDIILD